MKEETMVVGPSSGLKQGDIIKISNVGGDSYAPELGVIINADCDMEHGKIDGVISYLPIYSFRSYLERFWVSEFIGERVGLCTRKIAEILSYSKSEIDDLTRWVEESSVDEVCERILKGRELKEKKTKDLKKEIAILKGLVCSKLEGFEKFSFLCGQESDFDSFARKQLENAKKNMGDGHFMISSIRGLVEIGFVIRMRRIYSISSSKCFSSICDQKTKSDADETSAVRVASLIPTYQYKVLQLFAHQYSRIGLPDEVTSLNDMAIDDVISVLKRCAT